MGQIVRNLLFPAAILVTASACAIVPERADTQAAFNSCRSIKDKAERDACIETAKLNAEIARRDYISDKQEEQEEYERRRTMEDAYGLTKDSPSGPGANSGDAGTNSRD